MNKRLISVFVFALTVSAGAAFVLYQLISSKVTAGAASHPATKSVFVASRDLLPGALITERDISKEDYIAVPDGAITKKEDILNRGVIAAIHRDAPFFDSTLAKQGEGAGFATIIPDGHAGIHRPCERSGRSCGLCCGGHARRRSCRGYAAGRFAGCRLH